MPELGKTLLLKYPELTAYWKFEGNSNDSKGSNNGSDTSISYGTQYGKFNQGAALTVAGNSVITIPNSADLNPTTAMSCGLWFYPTENTASTYRDLIIKKFVGSVGGNEQYYLGRDIGNMLIGAAKVGGVMKYVIPSTDETGWNLYTNKWTLAILTYDGANVNLYVNGKFIKATAATGTLDTSTESLRFGKTYSAYDGYIDEGFVIKDKALSPGEILYLYGSTMPNNYQFVRVENGMSTGERIR